MAVGFSNTNKPLNPRGNDASPKGYNRAALYSGKALDFDGANDELSLDGFTMSGDTATLSFYLKANDWDANSFIFAAGTPEIVIGSTTGGNNLSFYDSSSWQTFGTISDTTSTNFFSIVFDGTTAIAYMNGVKFGETLTITAIDLSSVTGVKLMAKYTGGAWFFNGQLSGFKIFNTALTAAQVADLYNNPEKVVPTGVDNTALKLWLPMQEGAGTTAFNGAPDALGSNVVTNGTFDTDSDWTKDTGWTIGNGKATRSGASSNSFIRQDFDVVSGTTYMLKYDRTYISGDGETNCYSYFEGNVSRSTRGIYSSTTQETVTVVDTFTPTHSGNLGFRLYGIGTFEGSIDNIEIKPISGIGTISGATWTHGIGAPVAQTSVIDWNKIQARTNGGGLNEVLIPQGLTAGRDLLGNLFENVRKQGALNLDGNSWAEVHDNASLDITAFSVEAWAYPIQAATSAGEEIVGKYYASSLPYNSYGIEWLTDRFRVNYGDTSNVFNTINAGSSQALNNWHHIVGTYDGANLKIYINGTESNSVAKTSSVIQGSGSTYIGSWGGGLGTATQTFDGPIAQPRIYNRALTAAEVLQNYNSGKSIYTNS